MVQERIINYVRGHNGVRNFLLRFSRNLVDRRMRLLLPHLEVGERVLDVGCGAATVWDALNRRGFLVTGLDVKDLSLFSQLRPVLYDGKKFPFDNDSFDVSVIITTLHHAPDPDAILQESCRVAPRIILIEDVFESTVQKYLTFVMDSLINFEFFGHPHTNRTCAEWEAALVQAGYHRVQSSTEPFWGLFKSATLWAERV